MLLAGLCQRRACTMGWGKGGACLEEHHASCPGAPLPRAATKYWCWSSQGLPTTCNWNTAGYTSGE
jgi:hypothetical protein